MNDKHKNSPLHFIFRNCREFKFLISLHLFVVIYNAIDISLWPYLSKLLIDQVTISTPQNVIENTRLILIALIIFTTLPGLIWRISDYAWTKITPALKKKIAVEAMAKMMQHSQNFFQNNFAGALATRVKELSGETPKLLEILLYNFLGVFLSIAIAFFTLLHIHKIFALALIIWAAIFILMAIKSAKKTIKMSMDISEQSSKISGNLVDILSNVNNVKFFNNYEKETTRTANLCEHYTKLSEKRGFFLLRFYLQHGLTFSAYFIFCIIALVYLYAQNQVSIGDFALISTLNSFIIHHMWMAANEMRTFLEYYGTVKWALQVVNEKNEIQNTADARELQVRRGEIIFEDVEFFYKEKTPPNEIAPVDWSLVGYADEKLFSEEAKVPFFSHQSIRINSGQKVGLVGHSGSGKTTFVNLILRAFDVTQGRILIDGQDISQVTQSSLRAAISLIPQDPSLFHRSLRDNIAYAKNDARELEIIDAAQNAHAHDFIIKLPQGYNSLVGERGIKLSGGQRQRIAIARAFLKNSPILILDEATSQLDSITENLIQDSLQKLMQNKTVLVIAHRLSTLQEMDRILVFNKGKIVEDGTHQNLLKLNGYYKKLWNAQIGGFLGEQ